MGRCHELFGRDEMMLNGGLWRTRAREDAHKLERVLNELNSMQKEGRAVRSAGACATDLWIRFS